MVGVDDLEFRYATGGFALRVPDLRVARGAAAALVGPSGSGKTTLLNLLAGIEVPARGRVEIDGTDVAGLGPTARRRFRIRRIGLVFQSFELLDYLSVIDNILLPYRMSSALVLDDEARARAADLASRTGIADKTRRRTSRLSQGERQRVAVCRALVTRPALLLADEPTGNLDPDNRRRVLDLVVTSARAEEATLLVVTHDHDALDCFDRVLDVGALAGVAQDGAP